MGAVVARAVAGTERAAGRRCTANMTRSTAAAALALAALLAAPAPGAAKGVAAASVCGADGCRRVDRGAVRAGLEAFAAAPAPRRAEPFFVVRVRARVASGRVVEVFALDWLPRAGLTRGSGARPWSRPAPVLARALRRAARGLRAHPAAALGAVDPGPPQAPVVEVL